MEVRSYRRWLCLSYLLGVSLLLLQPLRGFLKTGMIPYRGIDESLYLIRLQEGLLSPFADTTNGIWGGEGAPAGMQMALMERTAGWLFGWTGLDATMIAILVTAFVAPTAILLMAALLRRVGSSRMQALLLSLLFFVVMGLLRRTFNPSWSMPILMMAIAMLWRWWESRHMRDMVMAAVLFGVLPGVYFWAWTYGWAVLGILFLLSLHAYNSAEGRKRILQFAALGILTLLVASPILFQIWQTAHDPIFPEASLRMGLLYARAFESLPRSVLIALLAGGALWVLRRDPIEKSAPLLAIVLAAFVVMHQQFVHGRIMSFSSHYYWYVCLAAMLATGAVLARWKWRPGHIAVLGSSSLLLFGAWIDYQGRLTLLFPPSEASLRFSHLRPLIEALRIDPIETILTDRETANVIASMTDDDVVYTDYSKILLISTYERAQRYCLSEVLGTEPIHETFLAEFDDEKSLAGRAQAAWLYARHVQIQADACAWVREDLPRALRAFKVTTVLWNMREQPDWDIHHSFLRLRQEGEGWKLFDVEI